MGEKPLDEATESLAFRIRRSNTVASDWSCTGWEKHAEDSARELGVVTARKRKQQQLMDPPLVAEDRHAVVVCANRAAFAIKIAVRSDSCETPIMKGTVHHPACALRPEIGGVSLVLCGK